MRLPPTDPSVPYSRLRAQLDTGDLFFLHTTSAAGVMIERLEQYAGLPPYSHIAMVIKDGNDLYLWDAPGGGDCFHDPYEPDRDNRIHGLPVHTGCRVSVLDDVLAYYATRVDVGGFWVRQLAPPVSPDQFVALRRFINRVDGLPFLVQFGYSELFENFIAGRKGEWLFFGTYFCSQLVADSYMHMGLLSMDHLPPNAYTPAAFGTNDDRSLPLVPPARLGEVFFVTWDRPTGAGIPCDH
jgi:hypothetical protein